MKHECGEKITPYSIPWKSERKPGLNPYESALAVEDGFTEPGPYCPKCQKYLTVEEIELLRKEIVEV